MGSEVCHTVKVNQQHNKQNNQQQQQPILKPFKLNVSIKSKTTNRILDVCQDKDAYGLLIIYQNFDQINQRFDIYKTSSQNYYIANKKTGKYLTVGSNSSKDNASIFEQPTSGLKGQAFKLQNIKDNQYQIKTFCGKALSLNNKETANGTRVVQLENKKLNDQIWIIS